MGDVLNLKDLVDAQQSWASCDAVALGKLEGCAKCRSLRRPWTRSSLPRLPRGYQWFFQVVRAEGAIASQGDRRILYELVCAGTLPGSC